ncbi:MAG: TetR/AcrR family transcriptional regulator [Gemmatimonadetes bacterium]|nr:TetR/AcrR family transcriptional regulator [Gemmatimonadota bacterium]
MDRHELSSSAAGAGPGASPDSGAYRGPDTRTRLLDAAEQAFGERGISATSLRQITAAAGANIAAVNYHFGSKSGLVEAVFERRIRPLGEERHRRLRAVLEAAGDRAPTVEGILTAFLAPVQQVVENPSRGGRQFLQLMARANLESSDEIHEIIFAQFKDSGMEFLNAFERALPELTRTEIFVRFRFCLGAMLFGFASVLDPSRIKMLDAPALRTEDTLHQLVTFLAAGFRTPAPPGGDA